MKASEVARRYFVINGFDGILTAMGILAGALTSGVADPRVVFILGLTTSVTVGISGFLGAFLSEKAEREHKIKEIERHIQKDLHGTKFFWNEVFFAPLVVAAVDGLTPVLFSLLIFLPFVLLPELAYPIAFAIAGVLLFAVGAYLSKLSGKHPLYYGSLVLFSGLVGFLASLALGVTAA